MRKVLLLVTTLFLVSVSAWALSDDFYNQGVSIQAAQCLAEKNAIGEQPVMLAGNNMITDGQQEMQAAAQHRGDFYGGVLAEHVEEYQAENQANWAAPTLLAGNNMITGSQPSRGREDFYNRTLAANVGEFRTESNSIGEGRLELANMITGEQVFSPEEQAAPADFYNQVLAAQVVEYNVDNNVIAPSNTEFLESPSLTLMPGSIASNLGVESTGDWYSQTVAIQTELNLRVKRSQDQNGF